MVKDKPANSAVKLKNADKRQFAYTKDGRLVPTQTKDELKKRFASKRYMKKKSAFPRGFAIFIFVLVLIFLTLRAVDIIFYNDMQQFLKDIFDKVFHFFDRLDNFLFGAYKGQLVFTVHGVDIDKMTLYGFIYLVFLGISLSLIFFFVFSFFSWINRKVKARREAKANIDNYLDEVKTNALSNNYVVSKKGVLLPVYSATEMRDVFSYERYKRRAPVFRIVIGIVLLLVALLLTVLKFGQYFAINGKTGIPFFDFFMENSFFSKFIPQFLNSMQMYDKVAAKFIPDITILNNVINGMSLTLADFMACVFMFCTLIAVIAFVITIFTIINLFFKDTRSRAKAKKAKKRYLKEIDSAQVYETEKNAVLASSVLETPQVKYSVADDDVVKINGVPYIPLLDRAIEQELSRNDDVSSVNGEHVVDILNDQRESGDIEEEAEVVAPELPVDITTIAKYSKKESAFLDMVSLKGEMYFDEDNILQIKEYEDEKELYPHTSDNAVENDTFIMSRPFDEALLQEKVEISQKAPFSLLNERDVAEKTIDYALENQGMYTREDFITLNNVEPFEIEAVTDYPIESLDEYLDDKHAKDQLDEEENPLINQDVIEEDIDELLPLLVKDEERHVVHDIDLTSTRPELPDEDAVENPVLEQSEQLANYIYIGDDEYEIVSLEEVEPLAPADVPLTDDEIQALFAKADVVTSTPDNLSDLDDLLSEEVSEENPVAESAEETVAPEDTSLVMLEEVEPLDEDYEELEENSVLAQEEYDDSLDEEEVAYVEEAIPAETEEEVFEEPEEEQLSFDFYANDEFVDNPMIPQEEEVDEEEVNEVVPQEEVEPLVDEDANAIIPQDEVDEELEELNEDYTPLVYTVDRVGETEPVEEELADEVEEALDDNPLLEQEEIDDNPILEQEEIEEEVEELQDYVPLEAASKESVTQPDETLGEDPYKDDELEDNPLIPQNDLIEDIESKSISTNGVSSKVKPISSLSFTPTNRGPRPTLITPIQVTKKEEPTPVVEEEAPEIKPLVTTPLHQITDQSKKKDVKLYKIKKVRFDLKSYKTKTYEGDLTPEQAFAMGVRKVNPVIDPTAVSNNKLPAWKRKRLEKANEEFRKKGYTTDKSLIKDFALQSNKDVDKTKFDKSPSQFSSLREYNKAKKEFYENLNKTSSEEKETATSEKPSEPIRLVKPINLVKPVTPTTASNEPKKEETSTEDKPKQFVPLKFKGNVNQKPKPNIKLVDPIKKNNSDK